LVEGILDLKRQGIKLITPEVKKANPSLFAAACKKHFFGTWKKALKAALQVERDQGQIVESLPTEPVLESLGV
jgi:hypothetical protein